MTQSSEKTEFFKMWIWMTNHVYRVTIIYTVSTFKCHSSGKPGTEIVRVWRVIDVPIEIV